ncbi:MAG: hypothetical protein HOC71_05590 [Candidatus Latescibacteria bacterium]|jgi:hypothetical protein|nr:hypothetical protein [Candidatus Latescibacterota bacterium]
MLAGNSKMITSSENIRAELINYIIYLQLMTSLSTEKYNVIRNPEMKTQLIECYELIEKIDCDSLLMKGEYIKKNFQVLADYFLKRYPLKKTINEIATEFNSFFKEGNNPFSTGIEYGWLESVMDIRAKRWPKDLPYQTKIGLGHHASYANNEDEFLLRDSFYTFLKAKQSYKNLLKLRDKLKEKEDKIESNFNKTAYDQLNLLKFNVSAYSRLTIISFYSFIECFVNTVGYNFYYRNKDILNERESEMLMGRKKDRFLQLEYKLEKFPTIIREDKKQIIFIKDEKQIKEPFKTFFTEYKNLRDASVHYAPLKEKIWYSPIDWKTKSEEFKNLSMDLALSFWKACYPESDGPEYLGKLAQKIHLELAEKRLHIDEEILINNS